MKNRYVVKALLAVSLAFALSVRLDARASAAGSFAGVLTYHNDNSRTGQNLQETILTPARLASNKFGRLFSVPVDGYIYGQPLYVPMVDFGAAGVHNVVIAVTEHDSVYAFDADAAGDPLWHTSFLDPADGITTVPSADTGASDIVPEIGITSTPVIDPATMTVYVLSKVKAPGPTYIQQLHALDLITGSERLHSPMTITADVPGTGEGGTDLTFNSLRQNNRAALTLVKVGKRATVYADFASIGDITPYHGWVLGYDAASLKQVAAFNDTPNGSAAGIWQSGCGPAVDSAGRLFVASGNGTFDINTGGVDYGDSVIALAPNGTGALSVASFFTPFYQLILSTFDLDLGTGGSLLLPDQNVGPTHLMLMGGKSGIMYLLNRDHLGGFSSFRDNIVQELVGYAGPLFSTATYWNSTVYLAGNDDSVKAFTLFRGKLLSRPASVSRFKLGYEGATTSLSANGNRDGILWLIDNSGYANSNPAILYALDPTDLSTQLYSSATVPEDDPGPAVKFTVPTVANGKVYEGTEDQLSVFGLTIPEAPAHDPRD